VPPDGQVVLESTPNGAGGSFYQEWQEAALTGFVRHFLPWWLEKAYREPLLGPANPSAEELKLQEEKGLDDEQLAFRRTIRANHRGKAAQEYAESPEECFLLSGDCMFDNEQVNKRLKECEGPDPMKTNACESSDNGRLLVWLPPQPKKEYIIGVDPASGSSDGDNTCAQVIERVSGMQCAELLGHFDPRETAIRVEKLARHYNNALVAVERNNHGHAVLATLRERYANTYENALDKTKGLVTTTTTRPMMIQVLGDLIFDHPDLLSSARLLRECRTFLRKKDGSSGACSGAHDDMVMAMAMALFVRSEAAGVRFSRNVEPSTG
jgi:Terminase RNaseH-like domain